jgi:hypothetical protein
MMALRFKPSVSLCHSVLDPLHTWQQEHAQHGFGLMIIGEDQCRYMRVIQIAQHQASRSGLANIAITLSVSYREAIVQFTSHYHLVYSSFGAKQAGTCAATVATIAVRALRSLGRHCLHSISTQLLVPRLGSGPRLLLLQPLTLTLTLTIIIERGRGLHSLPVWQTCCSVGLAWAGM